MPSHYLCPLKLTPCQRNILCYVTFCEGCANINCTPPRTSLIPLCRISYRQTELCTVTFQDLIHLCMVVWLRHTLENSDHSSTFTSDVVALSYFLFCLLRLPSFCSGTNITSFQFRSYAIVLSQSVQSFQNISTFSENRTFIWRNSNV
jgi:hypothetical protein